MNRHSSEFARFFLKSIRGIDGKRYLSPAIAASLFVRVALLAIAVLLANENITAQKKDSCVECHSRLEGKLSEPVRLMNDNIHRLRGISCNDCHGGDPNQDDKGAAKNPGRGYLGKPRPGDIPAFCGKCHNDAFFMKSFNPSLRVDQMREYSTSVHGQLLQAGDTKVATCVSCHSTHDIRAISDPLSAVYPANVAETCSKCHSDADYMKDYKTKDERTNEVKQIPTDQFVNYKSSVHARSLYEKQDLSAPTCNDCHGNHGAAPPGIASVANVCGQCHARQSELFQASPHKSKFDQMQVGECIRCHNNHGILQPNDDMIGTGEKSVCIGCHKAGDKGFEVAGIMRTRLDEVSASIVKATDILDRAERAGMEVSRPKFELREAIDSLTHARVLIHTASTAEVDKVIGPGLEVSKRGYQAGLAALDERSFRRKGLVVSLFFILILATLVYLKVREIENRGSAKVDE